MIIQLLSVCTTPHLYICSSVLSDSSFQSVREAAFFSRNVPENFDSFSPIGQNFYNLLPVACAS